MSEEEWRAERRILQRRLVDAEFARLAAEARAAKAERAQVEAQTRAVHAEAYAAGVRTEIEALRSSTSWRLTAPLRGVSRLTGKGG
jgi:hypothetical protein